MASHSHFTRVVQLTATIEGEAREVQSSRAPSARLPSPCRVPAALPWPIALIPASNKHLKAQITQPQAMKIKRDLISANSQAAPAAKTCSVGKVVCIDLIGGSPLPSASLPTMPVWLVQPQHW